MPDSPTIILKGYANPEGGGKKATCPSASKNLRKVMKL